MDRQYIEDHQVVERYLRGSLRPDEEQAFEEAYLGDPELLDEVQRVEGMQSAFKELDARGGLRQREASGGWLNALRSPQYAAAASIALVASLALSTVLYLDNRSLRSDGELLVDGGVDKVLPLMQTRGAESVNQLIASDEGMTVLLPDAGFDEYDSYRVTVSRDTGAASEIVVTDDGITLSVVGGIPSVPLLVPNRLLTPGEYRVEVLGRMTDWPADRDFVPVNEFGLSVTPQ